MTDRILDISGQGARLSVRLEQLRIEPHEGPEVSTPLDELAVLLVSNAAVSYSHAVLTGLARHGGVLVVCDAQHLPCALMLPIEGHHRQSERFARQAAAALPTCKRLWRQLIQAKVGLQGRILLDFRGVDKGLCAMALRVRSGDPDNLEGQAARRYWPALFDDPEFRRQREGPPPNPLLNYGYAVLRAMTARAICASGLHPSLGLHHHNRYDAFPLADDLMEPFRPLVDRAVLHHIHQYGKEAPLDKAAKAAFIGAVTQRFDVDGEVRGLFDILARMTASLAQVFEGERKDLLLPEL